VADTTCCRQALLCRTHRRRRWCRDTHHCVGLLSPCEWQLISGRHNCCLSGLGTSSTSFLGATELVQMDCGLAAMHLISSALSMGSDMLNCRRPSQQIPLDVQSRCPAARHRATCTLAGFRAVNSHCCVFTGLFCYFSCRFANGHVYITVSGASRAYVVQQPQYTRPTLSHRKTSLKRQMHDY